MQIKVAVTEADIERAGLRRKASYLLETPISVALERLGYVGAYQSALPGGPFYFYKNLQSLVVLKATPSKRIVQAISVWTKTGRMTPSTYFMDGREIE